MRDAFKQGFVLFAITVAAVFCLSVTYLLTKEPIRQQQEKDYNAAMSALLPDAAVFEDERIEDVGGVTGVVAGYGGDGALIGYVVQTEANGYGGTIGVLTAFDAGGVISGVSVINSSETPGLGENVRNGSFAGQFKGKSSTLAVTKTAPSESEIHAVSGATISSRAVVTAVNAAIQYYETYLKGNGR